MKKSILLALTIFVSFAQSMPFMTAWPPGYQTTNTHIDADYMLKPMVGAPRVSAPGPDGTVDVTVEIASASEIIAKQTVTSGVYDLRLFRDGQLVGSSIPRTSIRDYINAAPAAVERDLAAKLILNTEEDELWRKANDMTKVIKFDASGKGTYTFKNIQLPRDGRKKDVEFSAYAFNADRVKSDTARTTYPLPTLPAAPRKKAFVISVGVNDPDLTDPRWKLKYAVKDAQVTNAALAERLKSEYDVVPVELVTDAQTSGPNAPRNAIKANVRTVLELLADEATDAADRQRLTRAIGEETVKRLTRSTPEDAIIITFSSHGYADRAGIFYLLPSDIRMTKPDQNVPDLDSMISSDELNLWLRNVDTGQMLMIVDACYAAGSVKDGYFKPAPMGSRGLGQLAYDKQGRILTATQEKDTAIEIGGDVKEGLLTYALVKEGFEKNLADFKPKPDGKIYMSEWLEFAVGDVKVLFQKLESGELKGVVDKSGGFGGPKDKKYLQTPVLFDFRKNKDADIQFIKVELHPK